MATQGHDRDGSRGRTWEEHPWVAEGHGRVRLGVGVTARAAEVDGATRLAFARAGDELGLDSLWAPDHPMFITDCWSALAAYAAATQRVRLGSLVSCNLYRTALMTGRLAADVDRLSNGRAVLGIGAGWFVPEFRLMTIDLPEPRERLAALTRTLAYISAMWDQPRADIDVPTTAGAPWWPPVQRPRIPILVGGSGELITLRRVAEYADMCNFEDRLVPTPDDVRRKLTALRAHCAAVDRPYASVIKSYFANGVALAPTPARVREKIAALPPIFAAGAGSMGSHLCTPQEFVDQVRPLIAEGIDYLIVNLTGFDDVETLELLATRVGPALQGAPSV
jgi:alkanesulfonate monooxygenase SsuD/methylene tetrahydromethanopterin reductase-like flavin-dependent oxidoreductase (luciferase family)